MSSAPPPSSAPPAAFTREFVIELEGGGSWRRRRAVEGRFRFTGSGAILECPALLREPLRLSLSQLQLGAVDPGPARSNGGRFPVLRRLGPTAVVPRSEGLEGWLWTSMGGTGMVVIGDEEDAPTAALLLTKPLTEETVTRCFQPDFLEALAERSPLGSPAVLGFVFRAAEALKAEQIFRQFGLDKPLTDREVGPTLRRSLPTDRPADATVSGGGEDRRAATSVAPPGMG